jgi:hypothetical protein
MVGGPWGPEQWIKDSHRAANFADAYGMRPQPPRPRRHLCLKQRLGQSRQSDRFERRVYGLAKCACADWTVNLSPRGRTIRSVGRGRASGPSRRVGRDAQNSRPTSVCVCRCAALAVPSGSQNGSQPFGP